MKLQWQEHGIVSQLQDRDVLKYSQLRDYATSPSVVNQRLADINAPGSSGPSVVLPWFTLENKAIKYLFGNMLELFRHNACGKMHKIVPEQLGKALSWST